MAHEYLYPNAAGDETAVASVYGAATHHEAVNEAVADNLTKYIYTTANTYQRDLYNFQPHVVGAGTIQSVTIHFRVMCTYDMQNGYAKCSQKSGATVTDGTEQRTVAQNQWVNLSQKYTVNPATAAAYTWSEIDTLQAGVSLKGFGGAYIMACTQVYIDVEYYISILTETLTRVTSLYHYYDRTDASNQRFILSIGMGGLATIPMLFSEGIKPVSETPQTAQQTAQSETDAIAKFQAGLDAFDAFFNAKSKFFPPVNNQATGNGESLYAPPASPVSSNPFPVPSDGETIGMPDPHISTDPFPVPSDGEYNSTAKGGGVNVNPADAEQMPTPPSFTTPSFNDFSGDGESLGGGNSTGGKFGGHEVWD